ncbi:MAG TPA: hypothetical protein ENF37_09890 [Beggiatoa sp.]|nr:MAG: hypothetical protein B6247_25895 [Beggiatoa sp. 4572_84]HEW98928.1 hypothetical protein [Beggiatoa sp.]
MILPSVVIVVRKFYEDDYQHYLEWLKMLCQQEKVEIWAYCLMNNHVHRVSNQTRYPIIVSQKRLCIILE